VPQTRAVSARLARLRLASSTTPGKLVAVGIGVLLGAVLFGLVAIAVVGDRRDAAHAVSSDSEPLLAHAVGLYASLSDADATAATTFLTGGLEPLARRQRYTADLQAGARDAAALTASVRGSVAASESVVAVSENLPVYAGLVETARADNRAGLPVGAAYLREASALLQTAILPDVGVLYAFAAGRLQAGYSSGTGGFGLIAVIAVAVAYLAVFVLAQRWLASATRRRVNDGLLAATGLLVLLSAWVLVALVFQQNALGRAQHSGSDPVEALSATRILASRAQSDQSLTLVARGGDQQHPADFDAVILALTGARGGLLALEASVSHNGTSIKRLASDLNAYRAQSAALDALVAQGEVERAVQEEIAAGAGGRSPADVLDAELASRISAAQVSFSSAAEDARTALSGLGPGIPLTVLAIAALALAGIGRRLREYA